MHACAPMVSQLTEAPIFFTTDRQWSGAPHFMVRAARCAVYFALQCEKQLCSIQKQTHHPFSTCLWLSHSTTFSFPLRVLHLFEHVLVACFRSEQHVKQTTAARCCSIFLSSELKRAHWCWVCFPSVPFCYSFNFNVFRSYLSAYHFANCFIFACYFSSFSRPIPLLPYTLHLATYHQWRQPKTPRSRRKFFFF